MFIFQSSPKKSSSVSRAVSLILILLYFAAVILVEAGVHQRLNYGMRKGSEALDSFPIIDGHNDLPYQLYSRVQNNLSAFPFEEDLRNHSTFSTVHTDLVRLKQGKVGAQFWAAYASCSFQYKDAVQIVLEQIDVIRRLAEKYSDDLEFVTSSEGILEAIANNKIASLIGVESGHLIDSRMGVLRMLYDLGTRYMTLTHSCNTPWAENSNMDDGDVEHSGLTEFGKAVVLEMNRLGMMVDVSHVSKKTMDDAIEASVAPVIFSHSSSYTMYAHSRNVHDDTLLALKENEGLIMINFYSAYVGSGSTNITTVVNHINHVANLIGVDYVGIGGDYDGVPTLPEGLEDVSHYTELFDALQESNTTLWTQENLEKVSGRNLIRVFQKVEEVRDALTAAIEPITELISYDDLNKTENDDVWTCLTMDY